MVESSIKLALACSLNSKHKFYNFAAAGTAITYHTHLLEQVMQDKTFDVKTKNKIIISDNFFFIIADLVIIICVYFKD